MITRRCGYCESKAAPFEVHNLLGVPYVQRYRCACTARFDIVTPFGHFLLVVINALIVGTILFLPREKFADSGDRGWILAFLLGLQVPAVAILLVRSRKNERLHARI